MINNNCKSCKRATIDCPHPPDTFRNNSNDISDNKNIQLYYIKQRRDLRVQINGLELNESNIEDLVNDSRKYESYYHEDLGSYYYEFCFGGLRKCYVMSKR